MLILSNGNAHVISNGKQLQAMVMLHDPILKKLNCNCYVTSFAMLLLNTATAKDN